MTEHELTLSAHDVARLRTYVAVAADSGRDVEETTRALWRIFALIEARLTERVDSGTAPVKPETVTKPGDAPMT